MGRLDGKVVIITGAGSGIGRASSTLFADEGARVVVAELDEAAGRETAQQIQAAGGDALIRIDRCPTGDSSRLHGQSSCGRLWQGGHPL